MNMQFTTKQKHYIIVALIIMPFLRGMGVDLYVPSLPAIAHDFQAPNHLVQLSIAVYMLVYGIGQIFLGILSDSVGRKKILLSSALFYTISSFLAAYSPNIYFFLLCRALQGLGVAGMGISTRAIATDCFSGLSLNKVMSYIATSWSLGPIIGPFIGGYFQNYFNWQTDFFFFGFYGLIIFIYAFVAVPETHIELSPLHPVKIYHSIKTVITHPFFVICAVLLALIYSALVIFNIIGPFLIQNVLKYSAVAYGHIALIIGLGYFLGNISNRILLRHFKPMQITLSGLITALLMSIMMMTLGIFIKMNLYIILIPTFFLFYTFGFIFPNIMAKGLGLFPKQGGSANAIFGTILGCGVFITISLATLLKTNTQMPMAYLYVGLAISWLILFFIIQKLDKQ